jgi:uncharacterized protein YkwD
LAGFRTRNRGWTILGGAAVFVALALVAAAGAPGQVGSPGQPGSGGSGTAPSGNAPADDEAPHGGCGSNADEAPGALTRLEMEEALECLINRERAAKGLRAYMFNEDLREAARLHSQDMNRRNYFSHYSPEGTRPSQRARRAGYLGGIKNWRVAENLGWGVGEHATPRDVLKAWKKSPFHRPHLFDEKLRDFALGVARGVPRAEIKKLNEARRSAIYTALFGRRGSR